MVTTLIKFIKSMKQSKAIFKKENSYRQRTAHDNSQSRTRRWMKKICIALRVTLTAKVRKLGQEGGCFKMSANRGVRSRRMRQRCPPSSGPGILADQSRSNPVTSPAERREPEWLTEKNVFIKKYDTSKFNQDFTERHELFMFFHRKMLGIIYHRFIAGIRVELQSHLFLKSEKAKPAIRWRRHGSKVSISPPQRRQCRFERRHRSSCLELFRYFFHFHSIEACNRRINPIRRTDNCLIVSFPLPAIPITEGASRNLL